MDYFEANVLYILNQNYLDHLNFRPQPKSLHLSALTNPT